MNRHIRLQHLAEIPITNGLGLSGQHGNPEWPRYIRTTDIAGPATLRDDVFASQPPEVARDAPLESGDIVSCAAGSIGKSLLYTETSPACYAGFLVRFRANKLADPRFVSYWMQSNVYWAQIEEGAVKSTIENFSASRFRGLLVPYHALDEQRRIADFLDDRVSRIDRIIAARRDQIRLVEATHREHVRSATTLAGSSGTRASGVPWMPTIGSDASLWRIGQAFETGSGTTPKSDQPEYYDGDIPWVTTSDLRDRPITALSRSVTDAALRDYSALRVFPPGTLLMAMYGATVGRLGRLEISACLNQACCALTERGPVSSDYAFFWLLAHRPEIMGLASGSGQPNISQEVVRRLHVPAPDRKKQDEIVAELEDSATNSRSLTATLERSIDLLAEYRSSLITAAVTGELDASTAGSNIPG